MPKYTEGQLGRAKELKRLGLTDGDITSILKDDFKQLKDEDIQAILKACAQDPALKIPRPVDPRDKTGYLYPYGPRYDPQSGIFLGYNKKPSFQNVPDRLLDGGSRTELQSYLGQHAQELGDDVKRFFQARMDSDEKYSQAEKKKLLALYKGEETKLLPLEKTPDGFVGLNLRLDGPQTSYNGCWSTACSLLLKSRGVDLTQEDIRAFRPHPGADATLESEVSFNLNADVGSSVEDRADAILEALPNTAVDTLMLKPIFWPTLQYKGRSLTGVTDENRKKIRNHLLQSYRDTVANTIRNALEKHRSPVALTVGGHTVTITGIYSDNNTLRIEQSSRGDSSKNYQSTQFYRLDQLLKDFFCREEKVLGKTENEKKYNKSFQLSWIRSIDMPDISKKDTSIKPCSEFADSLTAVVNPSDNTVEYRGHDAQERNDCGQFAGVEVGFDKNLEGCDKRLSNASGGGVSIGYLKSYLPKKLYYKGDPNLRKKFVFQKKKPKKISEKQPIPRLNTKEKYPKDRVPDSKQGKSFVKNRNSVVRNKQRQDLAPKRPKYPERLDPAFMKKDGRFVVSYDRYGTIFYALRQDVTLSNEGRYFVKENAPIWHQSSGKLCMAQKCQLTVPRSSQCFFTHPSVRDVLFAVDMRDVDRLYRVNADAFSPVMMRFCEGPVKVTRFCFGPRGLLKEQYQVTMPPNVERACADTSHPILRMLQAGRRPNVPPMARPVTVVKKRAHVPSYQVR